MKDVKLFDANISKVVRTTRNDFAFGTSRGVFFFRMNENNFTFEPAAEPICLDGRDVTEVSEYSHDKFVIGLWNENDYLLVDRNRLN